MAKKSVECPLVTIDIKTATEYLGLREAKEDEKPQLTLYPKGEAVKYVFGNSTANRPFRVALAERYAEDIITQRWAGMKNSKSRTVNGETIIIDANGQLVSGQHRLAALLLAEEERKDNPEYYKTEHGCTGPLKITSLVATGIDPVSADTVDMGQKRTAGDVLFRQADLYADYNKTTRAKLCRWLAAAVRLAWLKKGGKSVSDAPHLPHSEILTFLADNPTIIRAVETIFKIEKSTGGGFSALKISQGYMAALMFLAAEAVDKESGDYVEHVKTLRAWLTSIASGENLKAKQPAYELRKLYTSHLTEGGSRDRDLQVVSPWVAAWNAELEGKPITQAKLKFKISDDLPIIEGVFYVKPDEPTDTIDPADAYDATDEAEEQAIADTITFEDNEQVIVEDEDGTEWIGTYISDHGNGTSDVAEEGNPENIWTVKNDTIYHVANAEPVEAAEPAEVEPADAFAA